MLCFDHQDLPLLQHFVIGYQSFPRLEEVITHSLTRLREVHIDERDEVSALSTLTEYFVTREQPVYVHNGITQLQIPPNRYHTLSHFHLLGFPSLTSLVIGDYSLDNVHSFSLESMPSLQSVRVGAYSLYNASSVVMQSVFSYVS